MLNSQDQFQTFFFQKINLSKTKILTANNFSHVTILYKTTFLKYILVKILYIVYC